MWEVGVILHLGLGSGSACGQILVTESRWLHTGRENEHLFLTSMPLAIFPGLMAHHCPDRFPLP